MAKNNGYDKTDSFYSKVDDYFLYYYALKLFTGNGVEMNKTEAIKILKYSINNGNNRAMVKYAEILSKGDGEPVNKKEAFKYYKMAADDGYLDAVKITADLLCKGDEIPINKKKASGYYRYAASKGDPDAMTKLAVLLENGDGIEADKQEALKLYSKAVDKKHEPALKRFISLLEEADKMQLKKGVLAAYYKKAADIGDMKSMFKYAEILYNGDGVEINKREALKYYKMCADKGNVETMYKYGHSLLTGEVYKNEKEGSQYIKKAAEKGNLKAIFDYGCILENGIGISPNKNEALNYYKKAADKGHAIGMLYYANLLKNGINGPVDKKEVLKYYKMAVDNGCDKALNPYANCLLNGYGNPPNKKEALRLLKISAEKGDKNSIVQYEKLMKESNDYNPDYSTKSQPSKISSQNKIYSERSSDYYERVIAIDNGSEWSKIGFADDNIPRSVFPTIMGYPRYVHLDEAIGTNDLYIGDEVYSSPNVHSIYYPITNGKFKNRSQLQALYEHQLYKEIRVNPSEYALIVTENANNTDAYRHNMAEIIFETFNVPAYMADSQPKFALLSMGRLTGISVNIGSSQMQIEPIINTQSVVRGINYVNFGGISVINGIKNYYNDKHNDKMTYFEAIEAVKKLCYVAFDYREEFRKVGRVNMNASARLSTGRNITIDENRFTCTECLFQNNSLPDAIKNSISKCPSNLEKTLFSNICVSGGTSLIEGLPQRLEKEIKYLVPSNTNVNIICPPESKYSAWLGEAIIGCSDTFSYVSIKRSEYKEEGYRIVDRKHNMNYNKK